MPEVRHFLLPRSDDEIVEDSWHVMGLSGTGSKDVRVTDAFVPEYRTLLQGALADGEYADRRADAPLYGGLMGAMGVPLHQEASGPGPSATGPTLVFLHGLGCDLTFWRAQEEGLRRSVDETAVFVLRGEVNQRSERSRSFDAIDAPPLA